MRELVVGNTYTLRHTGNFCHAIGSNGAKEFSDGMNEGDTVEAIYVGTIQIGPYDSETMERDIFYNPFGIKRSYFMFATGNRDFIKTNKR